VTDTRFYASIGDVRRIWTKAIRWLLRLDVVQFDTIVEEYLRKNRESLSRKRREWAQMNSRQHLSGSGV
jgi:hypothetical protein